MGVVVSGSKSSWYSFSSSILMLACEPGEVIMALLYTFFKLCFNRDYLLSCEMSGLTGSSLAASGGAPFPTFRVEDFNLFGSRTALKGSFTSGNIEFDPS